MQIALIILVFLVLALLATFVVFYFIGKKQNEEKTKNSIEKVLNDSLNSFEKNFDNLLAAKINGELLNVLPKLVDQNNSVKDEMAKTNKEHLEDLTNKNNNLEKNINSHLQELENKLIANDGDSIKSSIQQSLNEFRDKTNAITSNLNQNFLSLRDDIISENVTSLKKQFENVINQKLNSMKEFQEEKLQEIRNEITSRLHSELVKKIEDEFKKATDTIDNVNKDLGVIKNVHNDIKRINNIFENNKNYGTFGEHLLEDLMKNWFGNESEGNYALQYSIGSSKEKVDVALFTKDKDGKDIVIPIDSKFPLKTYQNVIDAQNTYGSNSKQLEDAKKEFNSGLDDRIEEVEKYIVEGVTSDYAIMYVPSEAIFYYIITEETARNKISKHGNIVIAGPTTIYYYIREIQKLASYANLQSHLKDVLDLFRSINKNRYSLIDLTNSIQNNQLNNIKKIIKFKKLINAPFDEYPELETKINALAKNDPTNIEILETQEKYKNNMDKWIRKNDNLFNNLESKNED
ncbi:DNA recombination protein RmuC [Mycoplasmopsis iners]|uniref:DNA recombination protein RmuC n=1 Tax=Mycoplasmopsis iners TaxID=76630 RepID=UPI00056B6695|nr:DNA recombination protein RmuC [Mycoplasmopsis iners]